MGTPERRAQQRGGAMTAQAFVDWTAVPAWLVKVLAERVYPSNPCGPGKYLDPNAQACVYICKPGYSYDYDTKSCVRIMPACGEGYVLKGGRCVPDHECDQGYSYDASLDACVLPQGSFHEPKRTWWQQGVAWAAGKVLKADDNSCPAGFYYDPNTTACVPVCAPGFMYDRELKKCVPSDDSVDPFV
ncbi:hypothetical protein CLOM_g5427 [Closterium sp. NIES-68]|nr:hypothetical protein CLOM_g5427 [Closterium sp. NIES-68]GJP78628.1 hypothetical protein CLOP_g8905 [Closterium sp. NIES-67]